MARARNIKPGFSGTRISLKLSVEARLLFIGHGQSPTEGRLEDR